MKRCGNLLIHLFLAVYVCVCVCVCVCPYLGKHFLHACVNAIAGLGHHNVAPACANLTDLCGLRGATQQGDLSVCVCVCVLVLGEG